MAEYMGIGIGIYLLVMVLIGYIASKKIFNTEDFLVFGRGLGYPIFTAAMTGCFIGGAMTIALPGIAFEFGLWSDEYFWGINAIWGGFLLCLFILGTLISPNLWRLKHLSIGDFYYDRFGKTTGILATIVNTVAFIFWVAVQIIIFAKIITVLIGWDPLVSTLVALSVICIYTYLGGLWAVSYTDIVQVTVIVIGVIVLFILTLNRLGDFGGLAAVVPSEMLNFFPRVHTPIHWFAWIAVWLLVGVGSVQAPDIAQRAYAAKNPKIVRYGIYTTMLISGSIGVLTTTLALAGAGLLEAGELPLELVTMVEADPELIMPVLFLHLLPAPLVVLFLGAVTAAVMAAADSALISLAGMVSKNIYQDVFSPFCSEKSLLKASRLIMVGLAVIAGVIAVGYPFAGDLVAFAFDLTLAGLSATILLGLFWKKTNQYGAVAGIISGMLVRIIPPGIIGDFSLINLTYPENWYYWVVLAPVVNLCVTVVVSLMTQAQDPPRPLKTPDGEIVEATLSVEGKITE